MSGSQPADDDRHEHLADVVPKPSRQVTQLVQKVVVSADLDPRRAVTQPSLGRAGAQPWTPAEPPATAEPSSSGALPKTLGGRTVQVSTVPTDYDPTEDSGGIAEAIAARALMDRRTHRIDTTPTTGAVDEMDKSTVPLVVPPHAPAPSSLGESPGQLTALKQPLPRGGTQRMQPMMATGGLDASTAPSEGLPRWVWFAGPALVAAGLSIGLLVMREPAPSPTTKTPSADSQPERPTTTNASAQPAAPKPVETAAPNVEPTAEPTPAGSPATPTAPPKATPAPSDDGRLF